MTVYRLKIVGVHYAVNPESAACREETDEMHQRTIDRLNELDKVRMPVVLMPEPSNPVDARAVMARVGGKRIGYVDRTQLDMTHALLNTSEGNTLIAHIDEVNATKHGWLFVALQTDLEVPVEAIQKPVDEWNAWTCTLPVIAPDEARFACMEAETMLQMLFANNESEAALLEPYINLWHKNSLHDLSHESCLMREHFIHALEEMKKRTSSPKTADKIHTWIESFKKQRTAICGNKRMHMRTGAWWKQLTTSKEMNLLWDSWMARMGGNLDKGLTEIEAQLRTLPFDLFGLMNHKGLFFSRLHYNRVPRQVFQQIVSVMLLRERTLKEMGIEVADDPVEEKLPFKVEMPKELTTREAREVLDTLKEKGYLDADCQPSKLTGWQRGVLAYEIGLYLGIRNIWVVMATLWKSNPGTLRAYYSKSFNEDKAIEYSKDIKMLIR